VVKKLSVAHTGHHTTLFKPSNDDLYNVLRYSQLLCSFIIIATLKHHFLVQFTERKVVDYSLFKSHFFVVHTLVANFNDVASCLSHKVQCSVFSVMLLHATLCVHLYDSISIRRAFDAVRLPTKGH